MTKAEKMRQLALSMKKKHTERGSFEDFLAYLYCLSKIKCAARQGVLKTSIHIDITDYRESFDLNRLIDKLEQKGFKVKATPWYFYKEEGEDDDFNYEEDFDLEISWNE